MKRLAVPVLLAACAAPAWASDTANAYGAVMGSYISPDRDRDATYGAGGQVIFLGLPLSRHLNLELNGFGNTLSRESDHGTDAQYGLGADLNLGTSNGKLAAFLLGGAGAIHDQLAYATKSHLTSPYIDLGAGLALRLTRQMALRTEARYYVDFNQRSIPGQSGFDDFRFNLGVQYSMGTVIPDTSPPPPPPPPPPAPPPPPLDSDGDGVPDDIDQCPNTPMGVKVDAKGCPLDSDGDGVPDYLDKCPGTPKGFKVDASGCIIEQTVILRTVNFEFNSDKLTPAARDTLDSVAAGLAGQPSLNVEIAGYTDSVGSAPYNLALSKKRAESVRSYLVSKGLSASRLVAKGYGKTKPIADNKTEEGRAENRRVEFAVLTKPLDVKVVKKGPTTASKAEAQSGEPKNVKKKATRPAPSGR